MNDRERIEILERIDSLEWQLEVLNAVHRRLLSEIQRRNDLLDELIQDQDQNDWWKNGDEPPC